MAVLELTCPHCGANIEVNEDAISFDCPRCGSRIILQVPDNDGFSRNIPMNRFENDLGSVVTKKKSSIRSLVSTLICVAVVACVGLTGYEWHCDREMKATRQEIESLIVNGDYLKARGKLVGFEYQGLLSSRRKSWNDQKDDFSMQTVGEEVRYYMSKGDFIHASSVLNSYTPSDYCMDEWMTTKGELQKEISELREKEERRVEAEFVKEIQKYIDQDNFALAKAKLEEYDPPASVKSKWEQDKQSLQTQIEEKKIASEHNGLALIPVSSKEAVGSDYISILEILEDAGFTNIDIISETPDKGLFTKPKHGEVKEIIILKNEKEIKDFKKEATFRRSDKITIIYYNLHDDGIAKINAVVKTVRGLIASDNYEKARSEIESFSPPDYVSTEWNAQKDELLEEIAQKESERTQMPISSDDLSSWKHDDLVELLKESGFNTIKLEVKEKKDGNIFSKIFHIFSKEDSGDVAGITVTIGGDKITSFKKGDYIVKTAKIEISYYTDNK